jgi:hypothetical protein
MYQGSIERPSYDLRVTASIRSLSAAQRESDLELSGIGFSVQPQRKDASEDRKVGVWPYCN